jgi:15-cis-phytoene synthase
MKSTAEAPSQTTLAQAYAVARDACRRRGGEWLLASVFLPRRKRRTVYAAMAMCQMVADALIDADGASHGAAQLRHHPVNGPASCCSGEDDRRIRLLRERLEVIYSGRMELPSPAARSASQHVLQAFSDAIGHHEIPLEAFIDFADAQQAYLRVRRYATWGSLAAVLGRRGGAVARIVASIVGVTHSDAHRSFAELAVAVQLSWLLRDMAKAARQGRIDLPLADMASFGYSERDLLSARTSGGFSELIRFEADRARDLYHGGAEGLCWLAGDGSRLAAAILLVQTMGLLAAVEDSAESLFSKPPRLSTATKLRRLPDAWRLAMRAPGEPLPRIAGKIRR